MHGTINDREANDGQQIGLVLPLSGDALSRSVSWRRPAAERQCVSSTITPRPGAAK
jgi:hypothetical protein